MLSLFRANFRIILTFPVIKTPIVEIYRCSRWNKFVFNFHISHMASCFTELLRIIVCCVILLLFQRGNFYEIVLLLPNRMVLKSVLRSESYAWLSRHCSPVNWNLSWLCLSIYFFNRTGLVFSLLVPVFLESFVTVVFYLLVNSGTISFLMVLPVCSTINMRRTVNRNWFICSFPLSGIITRGRDKLFIFSHFILVILPIISGISRLNFFKRFQEDLVLIVDLFYFLFPIVVIQSTWLIHRFRSLFFFYFFHLVRKDWRPFLLLHSSRKWGEKHVWSFKRGIRWSVAFMLEMHLLREVGILLIACLY